MDAKHVIEDYWGRMHGDYPTFYTNVDIDSVSTILRDAYRFNKAELENVIELAERDDATIVVWEVDELKHLPFPASAEAMDKLHDKLRKTIC